MDDDDDDDPPVYIPYKHHMITIQSVCNMDDL